jgi:hypothetical protein
MAVRNFWIEAQIDGRKTDLSEGPQGKDGGFALTVYQRSNGGIVTACELWGHVKADGTLALEITPRHGQSATIETER